MKLSLGTRRFITSTLPALVTAAAFSAHVDSPGTRPQVPTDLHKFPPISTQTTVVSNHRHRPTTTTTQQPGPSHARAFYRPRLRLLSPPRFRLRPPPLRAPSRTLSKGACPLVFFLHPAPFRGRGRWFGGSQGQFPPKFTSHLFFTF